MSRKLIIDGNAVYELDENCMLKKRLEDVQTEKNQMEERRRTQENLNDINVCSGQGKGSCNIRKNVTEL